MSSVRLARLVPAVAFGRVEASSSESERFFLPGRDRRDRWWAVSHFCEHGTDLAIIEVDRRVLIRTVSFSKTGFGNLCGFLRQLLLLVLEWLRAGV